MLSEPHLSPLHRNFVPNIFPEQYRVKKSTFVDDHRFQWLQHRTYGREESPLREKSPLREESPLRAGECLSRMMTNVTSNQLPVQTESGTQQPSLNVLMIERNDKAIKFYTDLPMWAVFLHMFMVLSPFAMDVCSVLSIENQMLLD